LAFGEEPRSLVSSDRRTLLGINRIQLLRRVVQLCRRERDDAMVIIKEIPVEEMSIEERQAGNVFIYAGVSRPTSTLPLP
jgi:hypothetical protein